MTPTYPKLRSALARFDQIWAEFEAAVDRATSLEDVQAACAQHDQAELEAVDQLVDAYMLEVSANNRREAVVALLSHPGGRHSIRSLLRSPLTL